MSQASALAEFKPAANRGFITVSIMLATIMQVLDTTITNVALPHMQGSLAAAQDQITWVLTSYIVAAAIMTPLTGWLSGRLGRKHMFLTSVAGFTLVSMLCGAAGSLDEIVFFRVLQGLFGAALVPLSQAVMLDINPREKQGQAMAMWGAGIMVAPILGPTLGGWITDSYSWRWVFYINVPVGILALIGIAAFVKETTIDRRRPFDVFGFAFLSLAIGALQVMLDRGEQKDWWSSPGIVVEAALALAGFWVFAVHSLSAKRPFVDLALLRDRNFVTCTAFLFAAMAVMYATLALLPQMLTMLSYPVVTTGMLLAPRGVATMVSMILVGRLIGHIDVRLILAAGLALLGISLWQMTGYSTEMDQWPIVTAGLVQGVALGFLFVPLSTVAFATLPTALRAEGTGIFNLLRNFGGSIGISLAMAEFTQNLQIDHAELGAHITPFNPLLHAPAIQHYWMQSTSGLAALDQVVNRQAGMIAYIADFKLMMLLCFAVIPLLLLLHPAKCGTLRPKADAVH